MASICLTWQEQWDGYREYKSGAIGSVNLSEFFVTIAEAATFFAVVGRLLQWRIIVGLIAEGVLAAPLAAHICKRLPSRALMILVGVLIIGLSIRTIYLALI